jgi:hypothetical protein
MYVHERMYVRMYVCIYKDTSAHTHKKKINIHLVSIPDRER